MSDLDRFANRSEFYARSRPGYPDAVVEFLREEAGWTPQAAIADVGAGTGISSELFLRHGNQVFAIEPNGEMRAAAEFLPGRYPAFQLIDGTAESTGLADASVDFVIAATAFHWFDADLTRAEFCRILRPGGRVVLMWNERRSDSSDFLRAYEDLLQRFGTDYKQRWGGERNNVAHRLETFFAGPFEERRFENLQHLDFEGLHARLLSSSYAPLRGAPNHSEMMAVLREIFDRFQHDGQITFEYETVLYWGCLAGSQS